MGWEPWECSTGGPGCSARPLDFCQQFNRHEDCAASCNGDMNCGGCLLEYHARSNCSKLWSINATSNCTLTGVQSGLNDGNWSSCAALNTSDGIAPTGTPARQVTEDPQYIARRHLSSCVSVVDPPLSDGETPLPQGGCWKYETRPGLFHDAENPGSCSGQNCYAWHNEWIFQSVYVVDNDSGELSSIEKRSDASPVSFLQLPPLSL